jgi:hypothetical protein
MVFESGKEEANAESLTTDAVHRARIFQRRDPFHTLTSDISKSHLFKAMRRFTAQHPVHLLYGMATRMTFTNFAR